MYRTKFIYTHTRKAAFLLLTVAFLVALVLNTTTTYAATMPGGNVANATVLAVDIARPATVRIITSVPAHLTVHFSSGDVAFPQTGSSYTLRLSGTGTFITSHGDILTADHVVSPAHDSQLAQELDGLTQVTQDIANYINQHAQAGTSSLSQDQVQQELISGQIASTPTYDTPSSIVLSDTDFTGPLSAPDMSSLPDGIVSQVDKIEKESAFDQQDTAIIHVARDNTLSVPLGDSTAVNPQDTLTIIGFPGAADVSTKPQDLLTSSLNQIYVSSLKNSASGAPLIEVGGNVEHGDSGGPALDSQGNIVGIVSFGTASGTGISGTSFLQASSSAHNFITQLTLDTKPGKLQQLWSQALDDYAATTPGHWHKALSEFQQIATQNPAFKGIKPYQDYAQAQAQNEAASPSATNTTAQPSPTPGNKSTVHATQSSSVTFPAIAMTVGALLLVLLLICLLFFVAIRPRKKKTSSKPAGKRSSRASTPGGDTQHQEPLVAPQNKVSTPPVVVQATPQNTTDSTLLLKAWPCGHMNRPNARFCSICGEPAPTQPPGLA